MKTILEIDKLYGGYLFNKPVIQNISFTVAEGEMVGLIGLNGAGKSTTIKHILGLLTPQKGAIRAGGTTLQENPEDYRASFTYVPESPELYDELTIREHLELTALAYGVSRGEYEERSASLLKRFRMEEKQGSFSMHLSKGMRQKVMLMNAFLPEPPLYIIDEPFLGLDPLGIRSLLDLMSDFKQRGASFLISSHILSTIEKYCDSYVVLHHGIVAAQGKLEDIRKQAGMPSGASLDEIFFALTGEEAGL
ncbi:ABC transporter ATP-binding protein [Gorillibacterium massiliense]|uniref:ABC transporter ATP-binding protein n=1 Tax=Gorillibacterium massiliense TaxID=1280390 RepID=UPI0004B0FD5D|nr:ABC transporter ATP-binding protein [Gorillibacterium massiliense]